MKKRTQEQGITLIELVIVLAIIAFLALQTDHYWQNYQQRQQLNNESQRLMGWLNLVASQANNRNHHAMLTVREENGVWQIDAILLADQNHTLISQFTLADSLKVSDYTDKRGIAFYGRRNMAQAGHISLTNSAGVVRVVVSTYGRIRRCVEGEASLFGLSAC